MSELVRALEWQGDVLRILDQRLLPGKLRWITARRAETVARAIESLAVRGAPVIGIAAAYGVALAALKHPEPRAIRNAMARLARTRPTGYNLFYALRQMEQILERGGRDIARRMRTRALALHRDDARACLAMARHGARLMEPGERVLTYCNTGALATGGIGTALGVIKHGFRRGKVAEVYACETRPVGQGARLTTWECAASGIPVTLICDNMAAALMQAGRVDRVLVGADRIARNGDTSNKIGTLSLALPARAHRIPFHVVAPLSTFDNSLRQGAAIPIEERAAHEIIAALPEVGLIKGLRFWNPAFDVTPGRYVSSFITEAGIFRPPYSFKEGQAPNKP